MEGGEAGSRKWEWEWCCLGDGPAVGSGCGCCGGKKTTDVLNFFNQWDFWLLFMPYEQRKDSSHTCESAFRTF